jgi:phage shock protein PspC (stress-responsive transcriptional regulator)
VEPNKLYRSTSDSRIAGVCGGLAEYLGVDSTLVRAIFLALGIVGGVGIALYLILWIAVPKRPDTTASSTLTSYGASSPDGPVISHVDDGT